MRQQLRTGVSEQLNRWVSSWVNRMTKIMELFSAIFFVVAISSSQNCQVLRFLKHNSLHLIGAGRLRCRTVNIIRAGTLPSQRIRSNPRKEKKIKILKKIKYIRVPQVLRRGLNIHTYIHHTRAKEIIINHCKYLQMI